MTERDADQAEPVEGVSQAVDPAEILRENARGASIRPVEFAQAAPQAPGPSSNIDLLLDVPLELTVELGRTTMNVRSILALGAGLPLVILGLALVIWSMRTISLRRAMGKELFLDKSESTLITHGPYAYTRNPIYLSAFICLLGWFFLLRLTLLGFLTVIFGFHFFAVAKWEERELRQRFGQDYIDYAKHVPLFFPRLIGGKQQKSD